ncbi:hypothetical protein DVH05_001285 [Phytophthora capsici]|nr:hypothetical protein DVH05_001285 [Phytophthora capsici]
MTDASKLSVASGNFGVGVLKSTVVPAKGKDVPAKEAEDPNKDVSQGDREENAAQTSVETDAPANEAESDVTQTVVQSMRPVRLAPASANFAIATNTSWKCTSA